MKYKEVSIVTKCTQKFGIKVLNNQLETFSSCELTYMINYAYNDYNYFYSLENPLPFQLKQILPTYIEYDLKCNYEKQLQVSTNVGSVSKTILEEHNLLQKLVCLPINLSYEKSDSFYTKATSAELCNQRHCLSTLISANSNDFSQYSVLTNAKVRRGLAEMISVDLQPCQFAELTQNLPLMFTSKAASKILHTFLRYFYVDILAMGDTFIKDYSIGDSLLSPNITIKIVPYSGINFDLYGDDCQSQVIVHNGVLGGHIGSKLYSALIGNASIGYSDLLNHEKISHQNICVIINNYTRTIPEAVKIIDFEISDMRPDGCIVGTAKYIDPTESNKLFSSLYSLNIIDFLNNVVATGMPQWTNNVYISNLYYVPPPLSSLHLS